MRYWTPPAAAMLPDDEIEFTLVRWTPELAKEVMDHSMDLFVNRGQLETQINRLAAEMAEGRWNPKPHETIALDKNGICFDGQHRLMAVIRSGCTVVIRTALNADRATMKVIGQGKVRTAADMLRIETQGKLRNESALCALMSAAERGLSHSPCGLTRQQIVDRVIAEQATIDALYRSLRPDPSYSSATAGAFLKACRYYEQNHRIIAMAERYGAQQWGKSDPLRVLHDKITRFQRRGEGDTAAKKGENRMRFTPDALYSFSVAAIRASVHGHKREKLEGTEYDFGLQPGDSPRDGILVARRAAI